MKKKHRDFNIFTLSALDLFCSALGVFMILCFVIFPYYAKPDESAPSKQARTCTVNLTWEHVLATNGEPKSLRGAHDVDLYVVKEAQGKAAKLYSTYSAPPTEDEAGHLGDARNTGCETWISPELTPGTYRIYARVHLITTQTAVAEIAGKLGTPDYNVDSLRLHLYITHGNGKPEQFTTTIPINGIQQTKIENDRTVLTGDGWNDFIEKHALKLATLKVTPDGSVSITQPAEASAETALEVTPDGSVRITPLH